MSGESHLSHDTAALNEANIEHISLISFRPELFSDPTHHDAQGPGGLGCHIESTRPFCDQDVRFRPCRTDGLEWTDARTSDACSAGRYDSSRTTVVARRKRALLERPWNLVRPVTTVRLFVTGAVLRLHVTPIRRQEEQGLSLSHFARTR